MSGNCGAAAQARVDPRARGEPELALLRDQADPARAEPAHGLRGSLLPEHRRVLRQGHRDLHDHGRHLHAALPVLRRRATAGRSRSTRTSRGTWPRRSRAEAEVRGDHQRRPRRPARRRRAALRRLHPQRCASCRRRRTIEILVPDFRGRLDRALEILEAAPPDVMNHNLETVPRLYKQGAARRRLRAFAAPAARTSRSCIPACRPSAA